MASPYPATYRAYMARTVYKPPGIPVFPPHREPEGDCIVSRIATGRSDAYVWPQGFDCGIAHRLDVQTSGALLVAEDPTELAAIRHAFAQRSFLKTYRFIARHEVPWDKNICQRSLAHDRRRKSRMVVQRGPSTPHRGRWHAAETRFTRLGDRLWQATMRTGVMHQIRVHAAFVGLVLEGDQRYGGGAGDFKLHHVGLRGPGWATEPVMLPRWAACRAS